jgi:CheY-like chemotaxis protein
MLTALESIRRYRVRLPLMIVQPSAPPTEHPLVARRNPLTKLADLDGVRVLAVDDDADALGLLVDVLHASGAEVATATSAVAALKTMATFHPHVLVADIGMPEVDGFELIKRVRASDDPAVRDVPAAALTAFARSEDRTKALERVRDAPVPGRSASSSRPSPRWCAATVRK